MAAPTSGVSVTQDTAQVTVNAPTSGNIGLSNTANISNNLTIANNVSLIGTAGQGVLNSGTINQLNNGNGSSIVGTGAAGVWNSTSTSAVSYVHNNGTMSGNVGIYNSGAIGSLMNGTSSGAALIAGVNGTSGIVNANTFGTIQNNTNGTIQGDTGGAGIFNNAGSKITAVLNLNSAIITGGSSGNGIYNAGTINGIANTTGASIKGNSAAGLFNDTTGQIGLVSNSSVISGSSGIYNLGIVTKIVLGQTSVVSGLAGAGVYNGGTAAQIQTMTNSGSITGNNAVYNTGTIGSFENGSTGQLTGSSGSRGFYNAGTVTSLTNDKGGTITAGANAAAVYNDTNGNIGTLDNEGTIQSASATGVVNFTSAQLQTFLNNGSITGANAVYNLGTLGSFENGSTGQLTGLSGYNAFNNSGKVTSLTNDNGGTITGGAGWAGIYNAVGGQITTLDNKGLITGSNNNDGQAIRNAGTMSTLTNEKGGSIQGTGNGQSLFNDGQLQTFLNNGSIFNTIYNTGTLNSFENGSTGTVTGGGTGGNAFYNLGTVTSLTNDNGGTITGGAGAGASAIFSAVSTKITSLNNNGTITGPTGVYNGGQITTLDNTGTISGSTVAAIYNYGVITTLDNTGTISGPANYGISNSATGSFGTINNTGTISGGKYGVNNNLGGTISVLNNYGTITGTLGSINNVGISAMTVNNYGVLNGSVALRAATLNLLASGSPSSSVVNGDITGTSASAITVGDGTNTTLFTANGNASVGTIQVASGSTLALSSGNAWQTSGDVTNNGTIALNAAGSVDVGAGGQFTNNGTLDLTSSTNAGNQMTVGGNYVSSSDSVLRVNGGTGSTGATVTVNGMSAGVQTSDGLQVSGAVTLNGGQVTLTTNGATLKYGQAYEIVSAASGVTGRYDSLNTNLASFYTFLSPSLFYTDNTVDVMLTRNQTTFASVARTRNGGVVAGLLDALPVSSPVSAAVFQLDGQGARSAFNSLSGEIHASARTALVQDSFFVRQSALDRLNSADCDGASMNGTIHTASLKAGRTQGGCQSRGVALWGTAYGSLGHNSGDGNAAAMQHSTAGFVMGADTLVARTWRVGGLVSYGRSMFDLGGDRNSSGHSNNVSIGGYGGTHWGRLNLRLGATYTWDMLSTSRTVALPGLGERLAGSYLGGTAQGFGELSYKLRIAHTVVEPFANVAYVNLHTNGYHEQGGSAALAGKATDTGVTFSTFGGRVSSEVHVRKLTLVPYGSVSYRHAFGLTTPTLREAFAQAGSGSMDIAGVALSTNAAVLDTGLTMRLTDRIDVGLSYIGQYGNQSVESGAKAHCSFKF
ncbi:MAG: autotransporter domain-containing protein [Acetobacter sp.]|uniref:autotransporter outer membrane beta-barrel domain-containing protein n=1 Tax=Acetobacter sp. TaxID=440 RepID=UPI0039E7A37C